MKRSKLQIEIKDLFDKSNINKENKTNFILINHSKNKSIDLKHSFKTELNNKDSKKGEFLYPRNIKRINQNKQDENNNIINTSLEHNIYSGINKENKDINLIKNTKELFISPLYNLDNKNINTHRVYRSPLRMADVFNLKKHHSINPQLNKVLTDNNIKDNSNTNKLKKISIQNKERNLMDNIKRIQNLKVNLIQRHKEDRKSKRLNSSHQIKKMILKKRIIKIVILKKI